MGHHASTPESVLKAPTPTTVVTARPFGATRQERHHGVYVGGLSDKAGARYLASLKGHENRPAVRLTPRRGRKVRRAGLS